MTRPTRITAAELARVSDRHTDIEQDPLPHTVPHEDTTTKEEEAL